MSRGAYATLNLSYWVGDHPRSVDTNWHRARRLMPRGARFAQLRQVHGKVISVVGPRIEGEPRPDGDGMVTREPGVILCIFTADCVPVLLADAQEGVIGALHAGWRGTLAGIVATGVRAMVREGASAKRIRGLLGPSIGPCCYEVDNALARRFARRFESSQAQIRAGESADKGYLNLRGIVADELTACGLERDAIQQLGPCTRCSPERYFSRRAAGGITTGLQLSFIGITEPGAVLR